MSYPTPLTATMAGTAWNTRSRSHSSAQFQESMPGSFDDIDVNEVQETPTVKGKEKAFACGIKAVGASVL